MSIASSSTTTAPKANSGIKATQHLSAGALSGFTSAICLQPLDLLKTRLQQSYAGEQGRRRRLGPTFRQVLREDGIRGLWRGTAPTLIRYLLLRSIDIQNSTLVYPLLRYRPHRYLDLCEWEHFAKSKIGTGEAVLAGESPSWGNSEDVGGIRLEPYNGSEGALREYHSLYGAAKALIRKSGVRGLFQGFTATAIRDAPYAGLYLVFYEKGKEFTSRVVKPEWGVPSALLHSGGGASAAILATLVTSPADTIKAMAEIADEDASESWGPSNPTHGHKASIYTAGFFSGASLRISRKAASSAIAWTVYETLLVFIRDQGAKAV